jgi:uncharacterized protein
MEYNKILKVKSGSHMYGLNTKESDEDYMGIMIPTIDYYFGMKKVNEVSDSLVSKDDFGKNTSEAIDCKYYEIREFFKLAYENNPNILEILFSNDSNIVKSNSAGKRILENSDLFVSSFFVYKKFMAYAMAQKKKMVVKIEYYQELLDFYDYLCTFDEKDPQGFSVDLQSLELNGLLDYVKVDGIFYSIGNFKFPWGITLKKAKNQIKETIGRVGNRRELLLKNGYDTKSCGHHIRLLLECKEILDTGKIQFPLKQEYQDIIMPIKLGGVSFEDVGDLALKLEKKCEESYGNTKVQRVPEFNRIDELLVNILKEYFK